VDPLQEQIDQVRAIPDPVLRAKAARDTELALTRGRTELSKIRREAILELREKGWSYTEIGKSLDLHRNRVQQIAEGRSR
jgi:DNA-directed RNA polymerase specialized sigma24 family protein